MSFSLVLATVGRTDELERLLASLDAQIYRHFELIVVDQNPDERLMPLLAPYKDKFSILHLRTGSRGAARARNIGLKHVSGDTVAFPDDDCWYPPDLLNTVDRFFVEHSERDGLTGRSIAEDGETSMGRFGTKPSFINRTNAWKRGIEYSIFLRRKSIRGIWFDEDLGVGAGTAWGAGEGTDYLLQLLERGASLYYDPDLIVVHPQLAPPYDAIAIRKAYDYGCGMGRVLGKHKMPLWFKAKWLTRPLVGAVLSLVGARLRKAEYHWNTFKGRLRGLLS